ncbi:hypothetical protein B0J14DRAFT_633096 [Halenospora varia]|nr:hypothetical protein B0J14DRAFT_633096 [Halenospora varia]
MGDSSVYTTNNMDLYPDSYFDTNTVIWRPRILQREISTSSSISNALSLSTTKTTPPLPGSPAADEFAATAIDFFDAVAQDGETQPGTALPSIRFPPIDEGRSTTDQGLSAAVPAFVFTGSSQRGQHGEEQPSTGTELSAVAPAFVFTGPSHLEPQQQQNGQPSTTLPTLSATALAFTFTHHFPTDQYLEEPIPALQLPPPALFFSSNHQRDSFAESEGVNQYPQHNGESSTSTTTQTNFHSLSTPPPHLLTTTSFSTPQLPASTLSVPPFPTLPRRPRPRKPGSNVQNARTPNTPGNRQRNNERIRAARGQLIRYFDNLAAPDQQHELQPAGDDDDDNESVVTDPWGGKGEESSRWIDTASQRGEELEDLMQWRVLLCGSSADPGVIGRPSREELQREEEQVEVAGFKDDFLPDPMFRREHHGLQLDARDLGIEPWRIGYRLEGTWGRRKALRNCVVRCLWAKVEEEKGPYMIKDELWGESEDEVWLGKDGEKGKGVARDGVENGLGESSSLDVTIAPEKYGIEHLRMVWKGDLEGPVS